MVFSTVKYIPIYISIMIYITFFTQESLSLILFNIYKNLLNIDMKQMRITRLIYILEIIPNIKWICFYIILYILIY